MRPLFKASLLRQLLAISLAAAISLPALAQEIYNDLASRPSGRIYFNSVTPKSKWELVHRKYDPKPTTIWGMLYLPENVQGRVPAMVISHGSAGVQDKDTDRWVRVFNQMGVAAFVVDSFGGRGIANTMDNQSQLSPAANDADALFALKLLSTDPRIDPQRIGQIGFSRGGHVAMDLVLESFRKGVIDDDARFVAMEGAGRSPNNETIIVARTATMAGNWIAGGGGGSINKRMTVKMGVQRLGRDHFCAICFPDIRCRNF